MIEKLATLSIEEDETMISYDVESLYTSIPHDEALEELRSYLNQINLEDIPVDKETILILAEQCLKDNYFQYQNNFYVQRIGLPMGGSLSSLLANIFMHKIDTQINNFDQGLKPKAYSRYIDDIWCVLKSSNIPAFSKKINKLNKHIKFTSEIETNSKIAFLDIEIMRNKDKQFDTRVFRKQLASNNVLHWKSYHARSQKVGIIYSMVKRAVKICSNNEYLNQEIDLIKQIFAEQQYPSKLVNYHVRIAREKFKYPKATSTVNLDCKYVSLPYMGTNDTKLKAICKQANIIIGQKPGVKIIDMRSNFKEQFTTMEQSNLVYQINCSDCSKSYIGETARKLAVRIKEHIKATKDKNEQYATYMHYKETKHTMDFENVKILAKAKSYNQRLNMEAAHIYSNGNTLNQNIGKRTPQQIWSIILKQENYKNSYKVSNPRVTEQAVAIRVREMMQSPAVLRRSERVLARNILQN